MSKSKWVRNIYIGKGKNKIGKILKGSKKVEGWKSSRIGREEMQEKRRDTDKKIKEKRTILSRKKGRRKETSKHSRFPVMLKTIKNEH